MKNKKLIFAFFYFAILLLSACADNTDGNLMDGLNNNSKGADYNNARNLSGGNYNYTAYDSLGRVVAKGSLKFEFIDSVNFKGEWKIQKAGDPQNIGPQIGVGQLEGRLTADTLVIGMNPGYADNNVFLLGKTGVNKFTGKWNWVSFVGPTNWGTFEAIRK